MPHHPPSLPDCYIISPPACPEASFTTRLNELLQQDGPLTLPAPFIQLRYKPPSNSPLPPTPPLLKSPTDPHSRSDSPASIYESLLATTPTTSGRSRLLLNTSQPEDLPRLLSLVKSFKIGGMHLSGTVLNHVARSPSVAFDDTMVISASCHSAEDLLTASKLNLSFAVLSPVLPSTSCPSNHTLGWDGFERIISEAKEMLSDGQKLVPIYALGGVKKHHLHEARKRGAVGVAGIQDFW
ncbi:thiamine monophosphate synthase/TENI-domain-containing protein [Gaertneriomyces semiglobifer]|nr:thiamine monophosphate synthase/TENI-domain-containing protein [Gaertneriomyces semiglobifer]